jgi:hypothetical protein
MRYLGLGLLLLLPMLAEAQAIAIGSRVQATAEINVRATPAGALLGAQPQGARGTVLAGPQVVTFNGVPVTWWQINYDSGVDGWSGQDYLIVAQSYPGKAVATASRINVVSWRLQWTDAAVGNGAAFEVERATAAGGPFVWIATIPEGTTTYEDRAVVLGQAYWYRVREVKSGAASSYSPVVKTP